MTNNDDIMNSDGTMTKRMEEYIKLRNDALLSLDKNKIISVFRKYSNGPIPEDEKIFWGGVHKARSVITNFPEEEREISKKWLKDNGF